MKDFLRISGIRELPQRTEVDARDASCSPTPLVENCPTHSPGPRDVSCHVTLNNHWLVGTVTWPEDSQTIGHSVTYHVAGWRTKVDLDQWDSSTWQYNLGNPGTVKVLVVGQGEIQRLGSKERDWNSAWGSQHCENAEAWRRERRQRVK